MRVPVSAPVDDAFGHWLAGFIDGEGSFIIARRKARDSYSCKFCLKLRGDDLPILHEIRDRLDIGQVRFQPNSMRTHPQHAWLVHSKADCLGLIELLDRFPLRAKKARDYAIWREAVAEWSTKRGHNGHRRQDWSLMAELKTKLEAVRQYEDLSEPVIDVARLTDRVVQLMLE